MLSPFTRLAMVLTSLSPMALVYGVTLFWTSDGKVGWSWAAVAWIIGAVAVASVCFLLMHFVRTTGETELLQVERTEMQDKEILTFLVSYLLPVVKPSNINWPGFAAFAVIVVVVLYQAEVLNVNPILGIFGYHFHKTTTKSGATYLIITSRHSATLKGDIKAARVTDHVWLKVD